MDCLNVDGRVITIGIYALVIFLLHLIFEE